MKTTEKNYVYGAGRLFFNPMTDDQTAYMGMRYFGNTTKYSVSQSIDTEESFMSQNGILVRDKVKVIKTAYSGKFSTDNINGFNLSQFFMGKAIDNTAPLLSETYSAYVPASGVYIQLGQTEGNPFGHLEITDLTVSGATGLVEGIDYVVDYDLGLVAIPKYSKLIGKTATFNYGVGAYHKKRIVAGYKEVFGMLRFIPKTVVGSGTGTFFQKVALRPAEDYDFKSNNFDTMTFEFDAVAYRPATATYNYTIAGI